MDPASAFGLIGSIAGVADVIFTSIHHLSTLTTKYRQANVSVSLLIGQLCTVQAALNQLASLDRFTIEGIAVYSAEWTLGLSTSLNGCKWIVASLDEKVNELEKRAYGELSLKGRAWLLWRNDEIKEYLDTLDRHVNALNLLLHVVQVKNLTDQRTLLEEADSVTVLRLARESTDSLCAFDNASPNPKSMSVISQDTTNLSMKFDFDPDLLGTRTYHTAFKHNYRDLIRQRTKRQVKKIGGADKGITEKKDAAADVGQTGRAEKRMGQISSLSSEAMAERTNTLHAMNAFGQTTRSNSYGLLLNRLRNSSSPVFFKRLKFGNHSEESEGASLEQETSSDIEIPSLIKILHLGPSESGKSTLMKLWKLLFEGKYSREARESFKGIIFSNIVQSMRTILEAMESLGIPLEHESREHHVHTVFMQPVRMDNDSLPEGLGTALKDLWTDEGVRIAYSRRDEYQLIDCIAHYLDEIDRIAANGYLPNDRDIISAYASTREVTETTFQKLYSGRLCELRFFDVGGQRWQRKEWIRCSDNVDIVFFIVDCCCYDRLLFEETVNRMQETLTIWNSIVNSRWFPLNRSRFVLLFTKVDQIESKLAERSPHLYFPDFPINGSVEEYKDYITDRFLSLVKCERAPINVLFEDLVRDPYSAAYFIWISCESALRGQIAAHFVAIDEAIQRQSPQKGERKL
ncbi:MAG: hypothetical protein Q9165_007858 [Trypethelium subeluteriae]